MNEHSAPPVLVVDGEITLAMNKNRRRAIGNESVPKIIVNNTIFFLKL